MGKQKDVIYEEEMHTNSGRTYYIRFKEGKGEMVEWLEVSAMGVKKWVRIMLYKVRRRRDEVVVQYLKASDSGNIATRATAVIKLEPEHSCPWWLNAKLLKDELRSRRRYDIFWNIRKSLASFIEDAFEFPF